MEEKIIEVNGTADPNEMLEALKKWSVVSGKSVELLEERHKLFQLVGWSEVARPVLLL